MTFHDSIGPGSAQASPHILDYLRVLHRRRWLLVATVVAVLGAALVYALVTTPVYRAYCVLLLQPTRARVTDATEVYDPTFGAATSQMLRREFLETQYRLILNEPNIEATLYEPSLGFSEMPEFQGRDPVRALQRRFEVAGKRNSYLAEVSFEWHDPVLAQKAVAFLVDRYIQASRERSLGITSGGLEALLAQAEEQRPRLEARSEALQQFMAEHNMVSLEENQNIIVERLKEISRSLTRVESRRIQAESRYDSILAALETGKPLDEMPEVLESQTVRDLKIELTRMNLQHSHLGNRMGPNHPEVLSAKATLDTISERLDLEVRSVLAGARAEVERIRREEADLRAALAEQERAVMEFNRISARYRVLKQEHDSLYNAHQSVIERINEIEISLAAGSHDDGVFIDTPPKVSEVPVRPRRMRVMALAGVFGVFLGVALCFFLDYLDTSIKTKEDVEKLLSASMLGYVPAFMHSEKDYAAVKNKEMLALERPLSPVAEAFRSIRTSLAFTQVKGEVPQLAVTSALPSEGKTLICVNVAIALAQSGKRVLLVDADLRRPRVHKIFGMVADSGLSSLLAGIDGLTPAQAVRDTPVPNLSVLLSGPIPPNPSELLGSQNMADLAKHLGEMFDYLIYDTPPAVSVTDSTVLGRILDGVVLVVRSFATDRGVARHAKELLDRGGARLVGVVLNGVDAPHGSMLYYDYTYKSEYYGESENAKPERRAGSLASNG